MKKAFFINGGVGRVLCAIPALEWHKENVDPSVIIVAEAWLEIFFTSPSLRDNVYPVGHKGLFEDKLLDREIISPEPYRLNAYFNQKCDLVQAFDMLINDLTEIPKSKKINLEVSRTDQAYGYNLIQQVKQQTGKDKVIVFQPLGSGASMNGNFLLDGSGRSFELKDIVNITQELTKHYAVIIMTNVDIPANENMGAIVPSGTNLLEWMGVINAADYFLGCDSMGQHYANALGKPATVVIGATFPENISYPDNKDFTLIDNGKDIRKFIPMRITQDFTGERFNEDAMLLDDKTVDEIVKSITNKLGKTKQNKEDKKNITPKIELPHVHGPDCKHADEPLTPPFAKKAMV
jgi:hypothetical protein